MKNRRIFRLDDELDHLLEVAVVSERKSASRIIRKALKDYLNVGAAKSERYQQDPSCSVAS
jgi:predicted transcriptional regulator